MSRCPPRYRGHVFSLVSSSRPSAQATLRILRPLLRSAPGAWESGEPLERVVARAESPAVAPCTLLEVAGARPIVEADTPTVSAFLDGVQRSRVLGHHDGTPLVYATVAAAIRERVDRSLHTWREPVVRPLLLVSQRALGAVWWHQLADAGIPLADIDASDDTGEASDIHPHAYRARALAQVSLEREQLERQLAARWCSEEARWLWIDGGISGNIALEVHARAFGVVKSHNTLYGDADSVRRVLALREGERSAAFLVGHRLRRAVASWYLRWRAPMAGDPLFGLVRVEVVPPPAVLDADVPATVLDEFSWHCDRLSAAILLERHPVSLPDTRWHTLAYGVYAVESYLKALIGS